MHVVVFCDCPVGQPGLNVGGTHAVVSQMRLHLTRQGYGFTLITGEMFEQIPAGVHPLVYLKQLMSEIAFDAIHIVTPMNRLGLLARQFCVDGNLAFTMTYDTQIPEYLQVRHGIPQQLTYSYMLWFAAAAERVIVPTPTMQQLLQSWGFKRVVANKHGVDTQLFRPLSQAPSTSPEADALFSGLEGPVLVYLGRISPEKSTDDFLRLRLGGKPHSKVVIGSVSGGWKQQELQALDPAAHFVGVKVGEELASYLRLADVLVFPSRTDTFGLVMLEAAASGVRVAGYPTIGTSDVITDSRVGCLDDNLEAAVETALTLRRDDCRNFAVQHSWEDSIARFGKLLVPCASCSGYQPEQRQPWHNIPYDQLRDFVFRTAMMLWAEEPAGPYDQHRPR